MTQEVEVSETEDGVVVRTRITIPVTVELRFSRTAIETTGAALGVPPETVRELYVNAAKQAIECIHTDLVQALQTIARTASHLLEYSLAEAQRVMRLPSAQPRPTGREGAEREPAMAVLALDLRGDKPAVSVLRYRGLKGGSATSGKMRYLVVGGEKLPLARVDRNVFRIDAGDEAVRRAVEAFKKCGRPAGTDRYTATVLVESDKESLRYVLPTS